MNEFWPFVSVRINRVLLYWVYIIYTGFSLFTHLVLIYFTGVDFGHNYVDSGVKFEISLQNPKNSTELILLHVKHQLFVPFMFYNQFVTYLKFYIYLYIRYVTT